MVIYSKIEMPSSRPTESKPAAEKTVVTQTNTRTVAEETDPVTDAGFENQEHERKRREQEKLEARQKADKVVADKTDQDAAEKSKKERKLPPPPPSMRPASNETNSRRNGIDTAGLSVDRSAFRETGTSITSVRDGSFVGTRSVSLGHPSAKPSPLPVVLLVVIAMVLVGGGAYYYSNPQRALMQTTRLLASWGMFRPPATPVDKTQTDLASQTVFHDISITSSPSGLPIWIDQQDSGEVTPVTLRFEEGRQITVTIKQPGYLDSNETFTVNASRAVKADFRSAKKGFIKVNVHGDGNIWVNRELKSVATPGQLITVTAEEEIEVYVYDAKTQASDSMRLTVNEGETRSIQLYPRRGGPRLNVQGGGSNDSPPAQKR